MNPRTDKGYRSQGHWSRLANYRLVVGALAPVTLGGILFTSPSTQAQQTTASVTVSPNPSQIGIYQSAVVDSVPYPTPQILEIQNPKQPRQRTYVIAPPGQNIGGSLTDNRSTPRTQFVRVEPGYLNQRTANIINFSF